MFWSLCYVVLGRLLQLAALRFRSEKFKELEIMVLRHKLAVLGRQAGRPELKPADQVFLWVKTQVASRGTTICRQNADCETPHGPPPGWMNWKTSGIGSARLRVDVAPMHARIQVRGRSAVVDGVRPWVIAPDVSQIEFKLANSPPRPYSSSPGRCRAIRGTAPGRRHPPERRPAPQARHARRARARGAADQARPHSQPNSDIAGSLPSRTSIKASAVPPGVLT